MNVTRYHDRGTDRFVEQALSRGSGGSHSGSVSMMANVETILRYCRYRPDTRTASPSERFTVYE